MEASQDYTLYTREGKILENVRSKPLFSSADVFILASFIPSATEGAVPVALIGRGRRFAGLGWACGMVGSCTVIVSYDGVATALALALLFASLVTTGTKGTSTFPGNSFSDNTPAKLSGLRKAPPPESFSTKYKIRNKFI